MRVAFAGGAPLAQIVLEGLLAAGMKPAVVVTNPDRPRGRRGTPQPPPLKVFAEDRGLPVLQPVSISSGEAIDDLLGFDPDLLVACAYGQILRPALLDVLPTIVSHPSDVPRWRGAAPVERALMAGETELGVATLKMTAGVDEGPVGDLRRVHVPEDADAGRAYELIAPEAVAGLLATIARIEDGSIIWEEQVGEPTYAARITAADRVIDWSQPAAAIVDQVRALCPHILAVTELLGRRVLIWRAAVGAGPLPPAGPRRLALPAGDGWVDVLELQPEGRKPMTAAEYLRGAGRALAGA